MWCDRLTLVLWTWTEKVKQNSHYYSYSPVDNRWKKKHLKQYLLLFNLLEIWYIPSIFLRWSRNILFFPFSNFPVSSSKERYGEVITTSLLKHSSSTTQMDPLKREQIRMRPTQYVCDGVSTLFENPHSLLFQTIQKENSKTLYSTNSL